MENPFSAYRAIKPALALLALFSAFAQAQTLPTGITIKPFYDTSKAGLSFAKDKQSVVGLYEVPGKPQHFLVVGFFGYVWSLYPDTTKTYPANAPWKDYTKKQVANFNEMAMKGWEQGALGGGFDPDFARNRYFYIIYNKYPDPAFYHAGVLPNGKDGNANTGLVAVERWKLSQDYASLARDTTILVADHGTGYGANNMVFGKDGLLYLTMDSYSKNSWDSTVLMRKILRIDVSRQDPGKLYAVPTDNPFYNASNPKVRKEIYAFGFRNTYSLTADYLTGKIWGAEVGQATWEEVNIIQSGKNYGWADGGDGEADKFGVGVEGPCAKNAIDGSAYNNGVKTPYSFSGAQSQGRTFTCADFTNGAWNFNHRGADVGGSKTAVPGLVMNCIILSQAFRGDPTSPFYGYHFVTDIRGKYFLAVKEGAGAPQNVGGVPKTLFFNPKDANHNGPTSFGEDAYGNMYLTMLASSSTGAFDWHDIYRLDHPQMKPLTTPRAQVHPGPGSVGLARGGGGMLHTLVIGAQGGNWVRLPQGRTRAELYALDGRLVWAGKGESGANLPLPKSMGTGALQARFLP